MISLVLLSVYFLWGRQIKLYGRVNFWYINCKLHDKISFFGNNLTLSVEFHTNRAWASISSYCNFNFMAKIGTKLNTPF